MQALTTVVDTQGRRQSSQQSWRRQAPEGIDFMLQSALEEGRN
jgi:hypothetical protein